MRITAGQRGDAAREARDKAENQFYWDSYNYSKVAPKIKETYANRNSALADYIKKQISSLLGPNKLAKDILDSHVAIVIQPSQYNSTYGRNRAKDFGYKYSPSRNGRDGEITIRITNDTRNRTPFTWTWRANFDYDYHSNSYIFKKDINTYSFNSNNPSDIEYFSACADIFKALNRINWEQMVNYNPYTGMEEWLEYPRPNRDVMRESDYNHYDNDIRRADIEDALDEWKKGDKWLYVAKKDEWRARHWGDDPVYDKVSSNLLNGPGYYRYLGETDKYYKVEFMYKSEGQNRMKDGREPEADRWPNRTKVRKDEFESNIYYPITWWGRA